MKFEQMLDIANKGYPNRGLSQVWDDEAERVYENGDTLALAIVQEMEDMFSPQATLVENGFAVMGALERMLADLEATINAVSEELHRRES